MKKYMLAATAAFSITCGASGAAAATFVEAWTVSPTGNISVAFGDNGLDVAGAQSIPGQTTTTHAYTVGTGAFTDTFDFLLPTGIVGFTLSSIGFAANTSLNVASFTFNGASIATFNNPDGTGGNVVMAAGGPYPITLGGAQHLVVSGTGGRDAVFSGTATFSPVTAAVPEPGAWALMIMGFGGAGALLRRNRRTALSAA